MENRRKQVRVAIGARVQAATENGATTEAILVDYSEGGVGLVVPHSIRRGARIKLIIGADRYDGVVGRSQRLEGGRGYSVGISLVEGRPLFHDFPQGA